MLITPHLYCFLLQLFSTILSTYPIIRSLLGLPLLSSWLYFTLWTVTNINFSGISFGYATLCGVLLLYFPLIALFAFHHTRILNTLYAFWSRLSPIPGRRAKKVPATNAPTTPWVKVCLHFHLTELYLGFQIKHLASLVYQLTTDWPGLKTTSTLFPVRYLTISTHAVAEFPPNYSSPTAYYSVDPQNKSLVLLRHQCFGASAEPIREEVQTYRADFNARLLTVVIGTFYTTYYTCILPLLFVQPSNLFYDCAWAVQHCIITAAAAFLLHWYYYIPCDYLDVLHRSALHLGSWNALSNRSGQVQLSAWSPLQVYRDGVTIRHVRGQFCSYGVNTAAEPGNASHARFHSLFYHPQRISSLLFYLALAIPLYQLISLKWVYEWYKLVGLAVMGLFNLCNLYFQTRSFSVVRRVYAPECALETEKLMQPNKSPSTMVKSSLTGAI
ncbi:hypothetical protein T265_08393 [Opisthorchis viverrini]|uniref:Transmembrane protein 39A n=2 Tax=Opisthorchis viverrini TaxID=6198 RepID=A0A075A8J4_OPIVI|nr:hypothetical protein T265_08393 [Opisthorchis viverrini]KER23804.1 hypothetical protein T265_08393 [Opisthorchis viverrini]